METTEYDLYDLLIGDDDISAIGDGSVTGAISSLSTSIANLVKIQYIESGGKSINNGANVTVQHTVTACPTGYGWAWVLKEAYRCHQTDVGLNGTSLTYKLHNWSGGQSTNCYARGYLVFYPSTWNI